MKQLRDYQKQGFEFLKSKGSALIGDEAGTGKSGQVIVLTSTSKKVLVLTMASLKFQFADEIKSWLPEAMVVVISGSQEQRDAQWAADYQFYVANYELLLRYDWGKMKAIEWDYIICDECTRLSNHTNKQYRALKVIKSTHRIGMTGTAISNSPIDAFGIFEWVIPGIFKNNYYSFMNKYTVKDYWGSVTDYKNLDILSNTIAPHYIRRTKEQVLPELPEKVVSVIPVELSSKERKLYDQIRKALLFEIEQADVSKIEFLSQITTGVVKMMRLRQVCNSMELVGESVESSKMAVLNDLLESLGNRKAIVFSEFSEMCKIINRELDNSVMIIGETSTEKRNEIVKKFNSDSDIKVLVMSSAGAYGLNLQAADVIVHFDLPWSVGKYEQRAARAHRMGQKNTVYEYSLIGKKTVDEFVYKKLQSKQDIAELVLPITVLKEILTIE